MDLEVKVAFQEALIADLDLVIQKLRDRLDQHDAELKELREQNPEEAADETEPPPHY